MYQYPYGDSQQLNLDWIINKLIELEKSFVAGESAELEKFANALISLTYIPTQAYNNSDIVFHDGHLYRCNTTIPAPGEVWDPSHWDQIMLGNTVANLVRAVAGMNSDHVFNESNVPGTHVTEALNALVEDVRYDNHKIQQKKNGAYTDVIPVEDTPSNNSDRLASSKAAYDLKGALNSAKIYFGISDLGLSGTPTLASIANVMANNSVGFFNTTEIDMTGLENGTLVTMLQIVRINANRIFAIGSRAYGSTNESNTKLFFASYDNTNSVFRGFYEVAKLKDLQDSVMPKPTIGMFNTFAVLGDSFASGYTLIDNNGVNNYTNSWCQILARKYGIRCNNYSSSGWGTSNFLDTSNAKYNTRGMGAVQKDITYNASGNTQKYNIKPSLYLICFGINDAGNDDAQLSGLGSLSDIKQDYTQNGNTFYGRYAKIIQWIAATNTTAKIICCTFSRNVASQNTKYAAYNNAIRAIAQHLNYPVADVENDDYFKSDFYLTNTMEGGHPTLLGYSAYAEGMDKLLSKLLYNNYALYNGFTETDIQTKYGYYPDDTITNIGSAQNWCMLVGSFANRKTLRFNIPLTLPVQARSVTVSGLVLLHNVDGWGDTVTLGNDSTYPNTVSAYITPFGIGVQVTFTNDVASASNLNCTVQPNNMTIAFS